MNTFINPLLTMVHGQISWLSFWSMAKCACAPAGLPLGGPMQCSGAPAACAAARGGRTAGGWTTEHGGLAAAWARGQNGRTGADRRPRAASPSRESERCASLCAPASGTGGDERGWPVAR